jgi:RNA polymerase sigma-70 factor, ECF subfamily
MPKGFLQQKLLVLKLKNKDPEAFAEIYNQYVARIYRFIFFKVSSEAEAQDLTSEVFLKTWQYISEGEAEIGNLNALLYRIARNCVIDWYRQQNKQPIMSLPEQEEEGTTVDTAQQVEINWEVQQVKDCLFKLKDEYREVLVLRFLDELEITEIAQALEKTNGTVRVLIHRALKALKEVTEQNNGPRKTNQ